MLQSERYHADAPSLQFPTRRRCPCAIYGGVTDFLDKNRGFLIGVFTILAIAGMVWLDARPRGGLSSGADAPTFELSVLDSDEVISLAALQGEPVVLDFFATWCGPCKKSMPALDALATEYEGRAHFFAVNAENEAVGKQRAFRDQLQLTMPMLPEGARASAAYKVQGLPTTVVLARDGTVAKTWVGPPSSRELRKVIDAL